VRSCPGTTAHTAGFDPLHPNYSAKEKSKSIDCQQCCGSGFNGASGSNKEKKNFCCIFLIFSFGHQYPGSGLDPDPYPDSPEMLDPDPDPDSMNPNQQL
jgi:hypothetical protein